MAYVDPGPQRSLAYLVLGAADPGEAARRLRGVRKLGLTARRHRDTVRRTSDANCSTSHRASSSEGAVRDSTQSTATETGSPATGLQQLKRQTDQGCDRPRSHARIADRRKDWVEKLSEQKAGLRQRSVLPRLRGLLQVANMMRSSVQAASSVPGTNCSLTAKRWPQRHAIECLTVGELLDASDNPSFKSPSVVTGHAP